jgi:DNA-binding NarL/FixJ family response regulator
MKKEANQALRVILADDHPIVRAGIREAIRELPGVEVVGEVTDGREAFKMVESVRPNLVLMDISMPGLNGLEAAERIVKKFPDVRVIILSRHDEEAYVWRALKLGASGYVLKKSVIAELKAAVRRVAGGEIYLSQELAHRMRQQPALQHVAQSRSPIDQLSSRQREILQLIAEGETTKGIALRLEVSPKTVEYHRAQLMQRLNIFDVPGLVRFAVRCGLVSQES